VARYLIKVSYGVDGVRGVLKEGGTGRSTIVRQLIESVGGTLESFYFAYGDVDAYVIAEFPDAAKGLAVSLAVNASGAVRVTTVPLITPAEMDAASKAPIVYRAPGT